LVISLSARNFVLFCTDQQRFDSLGCCGNPIARTPNLDQIAETGTILVSHVAPVQICAPSRASLFTGLYARTHGLVCNGIALDPAVPTLPQALSENGYRTHGIGKFHLQPALARSDLNMPESVAFWQSRKDPDWTGPYYGFDTVEFVIGDGDETVKAGHYADWLARHHPEAIQLYASANACDPAPADLDECFASAIPHQLYYNSWIADRAIEFLGRQEDEPFFLFVSFPDPHHPFTPPRPYCDRHDPNTVPMPRVVDGELDRMPPYLRGPLDPLEQGALIHTNGISESTLRRVIAYYYGMVEMIDDCVGRVMDKLNQAGLRDRTTILFTSDHGELLGDHGLLRKGPVPYRQLLEVPCIINSPGIGARRPIDALTSHLDLAPTLLDLADIRDSDLQADGQSMVPLLEGRTESLHDHLFAEYHPRGMLDLYNQTIRTDRWRMTLYPEHENWGELFDLQADPYENHNLFSESWSETVKDELGAVMRREFAPHPVLPKRVSKW
jgi:arylsulfatase A-like enzyme